MGAKFPFKRFFIKKLINFNDAPANFPQGDEQYQ